jgi:hypothetical protein
MAASAAARSAEARQMRWKAQLGVETYESHTKYGNHCRHDGTYIQKYTYVTKWTLLEIPAAQAEPCNAHLLGISFRSFSPST